MSDIADQSDIAVAEQHWKGKDSAEINMDVDIPTTASVKSFRHRALALVTFPWTSGAVMQQNLSNIFEEDHYAFVS